MNDTESQYAIYRTLAEGTNVNSETLLATDYLNHFNEALMLAELLGDMPDMLDDFASWKPKAYQDHFRDSGIADRKLAVDAYDFSPPQYKLPFEATVDQLTLEITDLQDGLTPEGGNSDINISAEELSIKCGVVRLLIDRAGGIINGQTGSEDIYETQSTPDLGDSPAVTGETIDQGDIDALFD